MSRNWCNIAPKTDHGKKAKAVNLAKMMTAKERGARVVKRA